MSFKLWEILTIMNVNMFITTLTIFVYFLVCYAEDEKRFLLLDQQNTHGIEATLQALTSRVDHLETQYRTDIARHQAELFQLNGALTQCQVDNKELKSELSLFQGNVSKLQTDHQNNISKLENLMSQSQSENQALNYIYNSHLNSLSSKIDSVDSEKGGIYVRWGRTTCPAINDTEMVYTGYTGGSLYTDHGGAANHLCMPKDPELLPHQTRETAHVYGTEYERNFNGNELDNDVPCSVCKTQRTSILMLPGRQHCYSGWVMEYTGMLVAGCLSHYESATKYICLDSASESLNHGSRSDNGNLLYYVSSRCGSLPCPPYVNDGTLYCVVCSKW